MDKTWKEKSIAELRSCIVAPERGKDQMCHTINTSEQLGTMMND